MTVVQDCRGRFRSEGEFYPFVNEAKDGYDAVEWAARLDGSTAGLRRTAFPTRAPRSCSPRRSAAEPRRDLSRDDGIAVLGGLTYQGGRSTWPSPRTGPRDSPRTRQSATATGRRSPGSRRPRQRQLVLAPTAARAAGPPPRGHPVLLRLDRALRLRRLLARVTIDEATRGPGPGTARRRLVRRLPLGTVAKLRGLTGGRSCSSTVEDGPWIPLLGAERTRGPRVNDSQLRFLDEVVKGPPSGVFEAPATAYVVGHRLARP